ncbi:hypothetical protein ROTAS13_03104 [Roseomonas sp. TAS13]|nr:hypothetical protein ROTAS13_03104 [Roseomonas sp. TAS13]
MRLSAPDLAAEPVRLAQEARHEGAGGAGQDGARRVELLDPSGAQHRHPVGDLHRLLLVVRDEDAGQAQPLVQFPQPAAQAFAHLRIQRREGLVQQQQRGLDRQRPGQGHALPLPAGNLVGIAALQLGDLHQGEQAPHALANPGLGRPGGARADAQPEGDILEDAHVPEQGIVLRHEADAAQPRRQRGDVPAVDPHLPGIREVQPGEDSQQRGLAGAGGAQQGHELAVADGEIHRIERRRPGLEAAGDARDLDAHPRNAFPDSGGPARRHGRGMAVGTPGVIATFNAPAGSCGRKGAPAAAWRRG